MTDRSVSASADYPQTIPQWVDWAAHSFGNHPAIVDGCAVTFIELAQRVHRTAAAFVATGVQKGDRVAIWAPNSAHWIIACLGAQSTGAVIVPLNTRLKGSEVQYILNKSRCRFLVTTAEFLGIDFPQMLEGLSLPHLEHTLIFERNWEAFLEKATAQDAATAQRQLSELSPADPSDILFTSGTTGHPKGVVSNHGQSVGIFQQWLRQVGLRPGDRYLIVSPFFHIFGYKAGWLAGLMAGCTVYPCAVLDVPQVCTTIARERITVLPGPPTLYQSILMSDHFKTHDLSSLRLAVTGAATIPPALIQRMYAELGFSKVLTGYGLTEAGVVSLSQPDDSVEHIATTAGKPIANTELQCRYPDGRVAGTGEEGEICIRGFQVMQGYYEDPEATAQAIDADGWLHTGDIGYLDDGGYLHITDRLKDMYICGGFNCYPAEIEHMLCQHPAIAQVAVIGVPDERMGEVGKAFVVLRAGTTLDAAALLTWSKDHMANYKVPRYVQFCPELPLNAAGKVQKFLLTREISA